MKVSLKSKLKSVNPGDLICCSWSDASTGKSSGTGVTIDLPVKSWGVFVGLIGQKTKHIVLAQNSFRYSDWVYDMDYTAIPVHLADDVEVLVKGLVSGSSCGDACGEFLQRRTANVQSSTDFSKKNFPAEVGRTWQIQLSGH